MLIELPEPVACAMEILDKNGFDGYLVGGSVRDWLLGKRPEDWDIATNALPEKTMACFAPYARVIPTGIRHGTCTILLHGMQIEVTTLRTDGCYSDARHPDRVYFTDDIYADLARRDFTMNAIAYNPQRGLIDPFGGQEDVFARIVRCVGDPDRRFNEDALRIMRGLRFMSQQDFAMDAATSESLLRHRPLLSKISPERIASELKRLLCGNGAGQVLRRFERVLSVFMPELDAMVGFNQHNPHHLYDVFEHSVRVVEHTPAQPCVRMAALLHDCAKPACFSMDEHDIGHFYGHPQRSATYAYAILARLRCDNRMKETVSSLIEHHNVFIPPEPIAVRRWLVKLGEERFRMLIALKKGDCQGQGVHPERVRKLEKLEEVLTTVLEGNDCLSVRSLAINGHDILALGVPAGPQIGTVLHVLFQAVLNERCDNEHEALLQEARYFLHDPHNKTQR